MQIVKVIITCMMLNMLSGCATMVQKSATNLLMVAGRAAMAVLILPLAAIGGAGGGMGSDVIGPVSKLEPNPVSVKLLPLPKELPPQKKPAD